MSADCIVSFYKFTKLSNPESLQAPLKAKAISLGLKGTILLAHEGINSSLCGTHEAVKSFIASLEAIPEIGPLEIKQHEAELSAFRRMNVKIKKEIVTMHKPGLEPATDTGHFLSSEEFKRWMDEGRDFVLVDTRNHYEVAQGTFVNAIDPKTQSFGEFPEWVEQNLSDKKDSPIVTFCTGGIRCEKATAHMKQQGFKHIFQIKGGILQYFADTQKDGKAPHWEGDCIVFDKRKAVRPDLTPTDKELCFICLGSLDTVDLARPPYAAGKLCSPCHTRYLEKTAENQERGAQRSKEFMERRTEHCRKMREQHQSQKIKNASLAPQLDEHEVDSNT